jgi:hypothetical protein
MGLLLVVIALSVTATHYLRMATSTVGKLVEAAGFPEAVCSHVAALVGLAALLWLGWPTADGPRLIRGVNTALRLSIPLALYFLASLYKPIWYALF